MFGRLTLDAFKHESSQNFAVIGMMLSGIGIIGSHFLLQTLEMALERMADNCRSKKNWHHVHRRRPRHVLQRVCRCPHDASTASSFCRRCSWFYFCWPLSRSLFGSWYDHDFFCRHGSRLWSHESHCPFANWSERRCLSLF